MPEGWVLPPPSEQVQMLICSAVQIRGQEAMMATASWSSSGVKAVNPRRVAAMP